MSPTKRHMLPFLLAFIAVIAVVTILLFIDRKSHARFDFLHSTREANLVRTNDRKLKDVAVLRVRRSVITTQDNQFVYSNILNEPVDTVWNSTFAKIVEGYGDGSCQFKRWQEAERNDMKEDFQYWKALADTEQIPWFLAYGSLLGYVRNKDMTPYDRDTDIFLPSWAYDKLRKYASPLPFDSEAPETPFLHLNPEFRIIPPSLRRMYNCNGTVAPEYVGFCTFSINMGRVGVRENHLDLWALDYDPKHNIVFFATHVINVVSNPKYFFPLRPCTFMGVAVLCPNDPIAFLRWRYGPETIELLPSELCSNGRFWSRSQNLTLHQEWRAKWQQRVGPAIAEETFNTSEFRWYHNEEFCELYPQDKKQTSICNFPSDEETD